MFSRWLTNSAIVTPESLGDPLNVADRDITLGPFDRTDVVRMQFRPLGQTLCVIS